MAMAWQYKKREAQASLPKPLFLNGSGARTRTADRVVNSHLLYQLSYTGKLGEAGSSILLGNPLPDITQETADSRQR